MMEPDFALFRQIAPEFAEITDEEIALQIAFATDFLSEKRFGKFYAKALLYLAAHFMKLQSIVADEGGAGAALTAGAVVAEKEGDLERRYADCNQRDGEKSFEALLKKTSYGLMFLQLRSMCIVPVLTRMG